MLAGSYVRAGDRVRAESVLARLAGRGAASANASASLFFHLACAEFDQAADYLEDLIESRTPDVIFVGCDPVFGECWSHPRIHALLRKMNLADLAPPESLTSRT